MAKGKGEKAAEKGGDDRKLRKLLKGARVAMLTTVAPDGALRSRPMAALKQALEGDLWFFTRAAAPKTEEIRDNDHVNVSFADGKDNRYLSVSGRASVVRDAARIEELWSRRLRAWFPDGKKDPDLALLRVRVERAEYWDSKKAGMVTLGAGSGSGGGGTRPKGKAAEAQVENRKNDPAQAPGTSTTGAGAQG